MSDLTANGRPVLVATVSFPRVGVWHAQLDIDADDITLFGGDVALVREDGSVFNGRVVTNGATAFADRVRARIIGGNAGFGTPCEPKFYRAIPASTVLRDALGEGGEALSGTSTGIDAQLPFWVRHEASVGEAFEECVASLGCVWRVLDDGTVWVGKETWPSVALPPEDFVLEEDGVARTATFANADGIRPGMTYEGRHIGRVEVTYAAAAARTKVWFQESDTDGDPVREALTKIVRQMTRTIDFLAMYPARVVAQNGDGTLELQLSSDRMPDMSRIPIRYGIPGIRAKVKKDSFVAVEFERGDPSAPVATVWDRESVSELTIKADKIVVDAQDIVAQQGRPLARKGDLVQVVCAPPGMPAVGQILTGNETNRG